MNKVLLLGLLFFFLDCQVFNTTNKLFSTTSNTELIKIHATIISDNDMIKGELRARISISPDSIITSIYPFFGIKLGELIITNDKIIIHQKLKNKTDTIMVLKIDPRFKLKAIQKAMVQPKIKRDTVLYSNSKINCLFTDYVRYENVFLPEKIILNQNTLLGPPITKHTIKIDYKSIVFQNYRNVK